MMAEYNQRNIFVIVWLSFPSIDSSQKTDEFALSRFDEWKVLKSPLFFSIKGLYNWTYSCITLNLKLKPVTPHLNTGAHRQVYVD